jgi:hypothetical protein
MASDVLEWHSSSARIESPAKRFQLLVADGIVCVTKDKRPVTAENVGQERSSLTTGFWNPSLPEIMGSPQYGFSYRSGHRFLT